MKPDEIEQARRNTGKEPREFVVGFDALAVYVNKENPINEITLEQLAQIFAEGGTITKWSQLGVTISGVSDDTIVRVSRQSSSGTYEFFREHVLNKKDFKLGSRDMNGSKEGVELVGTRWTRPTRSPAPCRCIRSVSLRARSRSTSTGCSPTPDRRSCRRAATCRSRQAVSATDPRQPRR